MYIEPISNLALESLLKASFYLKKIFGFHQTKIVFPSDNVLVLLVALSCKFGHWILMIDPYWVIHWLTE